MRGAAVLLAVLVASPLFGQDAVLERLSRLEQELLELRSENARLHARLEALEPGATSVAYAAAPTDAVPAAGSPPTSTASAAASLPAPSGPKITVRGEVRFRPEYRDDLDLNARLDDRTTSVGERARVGAQLEDSRIKALVEVQDVRAWGTEASTMSNDGNVDLHQAYVTLPDLVAPGLSLTLGRQELAYGDERLLGAVDWAPTGRSFDAGIARYAWSAGSVDVLAAVVNDRRAAQRGSGATVLSGLYGRLLRGSRERELDVYVLNLHDGARSTGEAAGEDSSRFTTAGARARYGRTTGLQLSAEAAFQRGHRGPDEHRAHATNASVGYTFDVRRRPTLALTFDAATGDGDAQDGRSHEFHNLFPTNHLYFGYADLLGWRNMRALRSTLRLAPREGHSLALDVHSFWLRDARGPWKDAGGVVLGRSPEGTAGKDIGDEVDVLYRLPVRKDLGLMLGYSLFLPGSFAERARGADAQSFGYVQLLLKF